MHTRCVWLSVESACFMIGYWLETSTNNSPMVLSEALLAVNTIDLFRRKMDGKNTVMVAYKFTFEYCNALSSVWRI